MIEILSTAPLSMVQDTGRVGFYRDGVGRCGAMDTISLALGNLLLANDRNAAAIEVPILPFSVRFSKDVDIAVMGADCATRLGDLELPPDWAIRAQAGEVLTLSAPRSGCRAYLCVGGGIDVPEVLGSRSTQLRGEFGGLDGRMLRKGDQLSAGRGETRLPPAGMGVGPALAALPLGEGGAVHVRVLPASEYGLFTVESHAALWESDWTVTPQSNRSGYRLSGSQLRMESPVELRSHGVVPGVIQVPAGGAPIIQLADAATMGGYPKIGTVIEADLWRLGQARPGDMLRFVQASYDDSLLALDQVETYLRSVEAMATRLRGAAAGWIR
ncbi:MAG: biotin-dependent carboxyltransferase family protein [Devosia sp.]|nr:biotin-dependent carboxyltransferase family protein [Devosia sp.]